MTAARAACLAAALLVGCSQPPAVEASGVATARGAAACTGDAQCASGGPCRPGACRQGRCEQVAARPGAIPVEGQREGDCRRMTCGVGGELMARLDPADVPADDGNPCTRELCDGETPGRQPVAAGGACEAGVCNARGQCVGLVEIASGRYHVCLRQGDGEVRCWGAGERGQASGADESGMSDEPREVPGLSGASGLALGGNHSCALVGGEARCWGANEHGQLGDGSTVDRQAPATVVGLTGVTALAAGLDTTCALTGRGQVLCWGQGSNGQLGHGKRTPSALPVVVKLPVPAVSPAGPVPRGAGPVQVSVGGAHACAVLTNGRVHCWGSNLHGQLGDGSGNDSATPVLVAGLDDASAVAAGRNHTCALRRDGTVWCWGWNPDGQLGLGHRDDRRRPEQVSGLTGVVEVAAGNGHSCARLSPGQVACWGWNRDGQATGSAGDDALSPVTLETTRATHLALGSKHSCALVPKGGFTCWGANGRGQLGAAP